MTSVRRLFAAGVTSVCAVLVMPATAAEVRDGRIAFSGADAHTHSSELYSMLPDGSDRVNLTRRFEGDARGPRVYSPGGRWIAFGCTKPGDDHAPFPTDVCVVKDGVKRPEPVRLTSLEGIERVSAFSPDSKWILFTAEGPSARSSIYLMRRNGRDLTKLTKSHQFYTPENATFTPDGKRILFGDYLGPGTGGVYLMDRDGSHLTLVVDQNVLTLAFDPLMSPDGTQILFFGYPADQDHSELFVSDLDGNFVRVTSDQNANKTTAGFSPDGDLIAYAFGGRIWTVRPDGTDTQVAVDGGDFNLDQAAWAPSGLRLVFRMKSTEVRGSEIGTAAPGDSPDPITDTDRINEELPVWARKP